MKQSINKIGPGVYEVSTPCWDKKPLLIVPAGGILRKEVGAALKEMRPISVHPAVLMAAAQHNARRLAMLTPVGSIEYI